MNKHTENGIRISYNVAETGGTSKAVTGKIVGEKSRFVGNFRSNDNGVVLTGTWNAQNYELSVRDVTVEAETLEQALITLIETAREMEPTNTTARRELGLIK